MQLLGGRTPWKPHADEYAVDDPRLVFGIGTRRRCRGANPGHAVAAMWPVGGDVEHAAVILDVGPKLGRSRHQHPFIVRRPMGVSCGPCIKVKWSQRLCEPTRRWVPLSVPKCEAGHSRVRLPLNAGSECYRPGTSEPVDPYPAVPTGPTIRRRPSAAYTRWGEQSRVLSILRSCESDW